MTGSVKEAGKFLNTWALSASQNDLERAQNSHTCRTDMQRQDLCIVCPYRPMKKSLDSVTFATNWIGFRVRVCVCRLTALSTAGASLTSAPSLLKHELSHRLMTVTRNFRTLWSIALLVW